MANVSRIAPLTALVYCLGCAIAPTDDPPEAIGPVIAEYALATQDGNAPPCCVTDSANVQITVLGGTLTFHGPANYGDTVNTPAGPASRACVHGVPNGSHVNTFTHVVTLPDGTSYLQLPCDRGTYTLLVIRRLDQGGSSTNDTVAVSLGSFTAEPNTVDLADASHRTVTASVSGATLFVETPAHQYSFDPVR